MIGRLQAEETRDARHDPFVQRLPVHPGRVVAEGIVALPARIAAPRGLQGKSAEKWAAGAMISISALGRWAVNPLLCR